MSRFTRNTEKFVDGVREISSSPVCRETEGKLGKPGAWSGANYLFAS
jgi:hypothetical protein